MTQDERAPEPSPTPEAEPPATPQPVPDPSDQPAPAVPRPQTEHEPSPESDLPPMPEGDVSPSPERNAPAKATPKPSPTADSKPEARPAETPQTEGEEPKLPGRGDIVEVTVRRLAPFGAFVRLADGRKGLVHISQVADEFVEDIKQHLEIGQTVRARITAVLEDGKVDLSIKKAKPRPKPERPPKPKRRKRPEHDRDEVRLPKQPETFQVNPLSDALAEVEKKLK